MTSNQFRWFENLLNESRQDGMEDAEYGRYDPPYPTSTDEQDMQVQAAYDEGYNARKATLGRKA